MIELIDGVQVTALTQDAEQVHIEAQRGDELLKLESKLLIAADGRDSFCRQAIGVVLMSTTMIRLRLLRLFRLQNHMSRWDLSVLAH